MKKILLAAATVFCMSTFAAAEPVRLTDGQMDSVTAAGKSVRIKDVSVNVAIVKQHGGVNVAIIKQHGKGKVIVKRHDKKVIVKRLSKTKAIAIVRKLLRRIPDGVHPYS